MRNISHAPRFFIVFLVLSTACLPAAPAADRIATIKEVEGSGQVLRPTGPDGLLALDRAGKLTLEALADAKVLPNRFWTLRHNFKAKKIDISGWTAQKVAAKIAEAEKSMPPAKQALEMMRQGVAGIDPEQIPPGVFDAIKESEEAMEEAEDYLREMKALYAFMTGRSYYTWKAVGPETKLEAGDSLRVPQGTEVLVRYSTGAVMRIKGGSTVTVQPRTWGTTSRSEVYARLWKGICNFYFPPGHKAAKKFGVSTRRAIVTIKGTDFDITESPDSTTVSVNKGTVQITDLETGNDQALTTGQSITFGKKTSAAPTSPAGSTPPATAPAEVEIPADWARRKVGNVSFSLPKSWRGPPSPTDETGKISPENDTWYASDHTNDHDAQVAVGTIKAGAEAQLEIEGFLKRTATNLSSRPALRYEGVLDEMGHVDHLLWIIGTKPDANGKVVGLSAQYPEAQRATYEPLIEKIIASVRRDGESIPETPSVPAIKLDWPGNEASSRWPSWMESSLWP